MEFLDTQTVGGGPQHNIPSLASRWTRRKVVECPGMDSVYRPERPVRQGGGTPVNTAAGTNCSRCVYPLVRPKSFPTDDTTF